MANTPKSCNGDKLDQILFFNIHKDHIERNDQLDLALLIFFSLKASLDIVIICQQRASGEKMSGIEKS